MTDQDAAAGHHDHTPGHGHGHGHKGGEGQGRGRGALGGVWGKVTHFFRPHSHEAADKVDAAMESSAEGMRALWISLAVLGATTVIQAIVVAVSGSVALLGDTLHNAADALTAVPLGIAFVLGRRPPTRRYTYGYGRAEDLAGVAIVLTIAASSVVAAYVAIDRLMHPQKVSHLWAVAVAALVGFAGNELVARYRIRVGRKIGSAALVADGLHARTDGFTSLAVLIGAGGVALGWKQADPVIGLLITVAILAVLRQAAEHALIHAIPRLSAALVHADPQSDDGLPGCAGAARPGGRRGPLASDPWLPSTDGGGGQHDWPGYPRPPGGSFAP